MDKYKITFETWNKLADLYQQKFMDLEIYNSSYDAFLSYLKKEDSSVLEIGCGPGNITKYLFSKNQKLDIDATDIAPNMVELAKKNVAEASYQVLDCRNLNQIQKKYDGIMCGFCLPYISQEDVLKLIVDCKALLNENGILYLSAIEGSYQKSGYQTGGTGDQTYTYYYESEFLESNLKINNFEILDVLRIKYNSNTKNPQTHLILISKKTKS